MISTDELKARACEKTGLADFGLDHFEEPLALWVEGLNSGRLNEFGQAFLARQAVTDLSRRLRVLDTLQRHPEIEETPIPAIIQISGHERSGTTLLHNLMMLHPKARALLRWELMRPLPPPEAATYATDPRIAATQKAIEPLRGSLLERMHWVNATDPEECIFGFLNMSGIMGGSTFYAMPEWADWILVNQPEEAFREYRSLIKLLLWRNSPSPDGHLILKAPQIGRQLSLWRKVFPEARMILTHRDPFRVCTSVTTLVAHICDGFVTEDLSGEQPNIAAIVTRLTETKAAALQTFDQNGPGGAQNVRYTDLLADPTGCVQHLHEAPGIADWDNIEADVSTYLKRQTRAAPPGKMPTHGLEHDRFLERPIITSYCEHFDIEPERQRIVG